MLLPHKTFETSSNFFHADLILDVTASWACYNQQTWYSSWFIAGFLPTTYESGWSLRKTCVCKTLLDESNQCDPKCSLKKSCIPSKPPERSQSATSWWCWHQATCMKASTDQVILRIQQWSSTLPPDWRQSFLEFDRQSLPLLWEIYWSYVALPEWRKSEVFVKLKKNDKLILESGDLFVTEAKAKMNECWLKKKVVFKNV